MRVSPLDPPPGHGARYTSFWSRRILGGGSGVRVTRARSPSVIPLCFDFQTTVTDSGCLLSRQDAKLSWAAKSSRLSNANPLHDGL